MKTFHFVALLGIGLLTSCATAKPLKRLGFNEDTRPESAIFLFMSKLSTTAGKFPSNCFIRIKNLDHSGSQALEFSIPESGLPILVEVTEGKYAFDDLYCEKLGTWKLQEILKESFQVKANRVAVLGQLKVEYSPKTENFSIQRSQKKEDLLAIQNAVKKMPQLKRRTFYNPYIDRDWPVEAIQGSADQKFQLKVRKEGESSAKAELLIQRLNRCEDAEHQVNGFRIANWAIKASYQGGRIVSQKAQTKFHSQSEIFENCIESAVQDFNPATESKVEIEIIL